MPETFEQNSYPSLPIQEQFEDGRVLFTNGEIIDAEGRLWGYRLFKALPGWDTAAHMPREFSSPEDYTAQLDRSHRG